MTYYSNWDRAFSNRPKGIAQFAGGTYSYVDYGETSYCPISGRRTGGLRYCENTILFDGEIIEARADVPDNSLNADATITLCKNGSGTDVEFSFSAGETGEKTWTGRLTVRKGDRLAWRIDASAAGRAAYT